MAQGTAAPALIGAGNKADEIGSEALKRLFEAFIACRTTLDDLSDRAATLGADLSAPVIAAHLTGKSCISAQKHDVLVTAVNARLAELSLPASARHPSDRRDPRGREPHRAVERDSGQPGNATYSSSAESAEFKRGRNRDRGRESLLQYDLPH